MTDFESFTHQQMRDMIASLDPASVQTRADQLKKASEDIKKIGEALKNHVVTGWEGQGADAFQEWVGRAGNATLRLSEYSAKGGEAMGWVIQTMTEATKMTAVDATATKDLASAIEHHNDPDSAKTRSEAQTILDADRREAIRLMTNLAQSYQQSSSEMDKAPIPTLPPPPPDLVPDVRFGESDVERSGGGALRTAEAVRVRPYALLPTVLTARPRMSPVTCPVGSRGRTTHFRQCPFHRFRTARWRWTLTPSARCLRTRRCLR